MDEIQATLKKIGTFMVDRRLWAAILALVAIFGLFGFDVPDLTEEQIGDFMTLGANGIEFLGLLLTIAYMAGKLISSWTQRPPSGIAAFRKKDQ